MWVIIPVIGLAIRKGSGRQFKRREKKTIALWQKVSSCSRRAPSK
jgi:hypothetical protein